MYRHDGSSKTMHDSFVLYLRRVESRIRLCTHAKRQGRERDRRNAAWPGPTNRKEGRWKYVFIMGFIMVKLKDLKMTRLMHQEKDITTYVSNCLTGLKVNAKTSKTFGFILRDRDCQKSYVGNIRKHLELKWLISVLEVSSWKDVVHFGKKEMLAPRYVGPFEIIKGIDPMAY
ncbi:hypothetical protein Tco_1546828 [Tanacetum coccineum]